MNLEQNKQNAIAFYKTAYMGDPKAAVEQYVGKEYIQHNPDVADGTQGFINYFERMQAEYPDKSIEFVRCIAEGNAPSATRTTRTPWPYWLAAASVVLLLGFAWWLWRAVYLTKMLTWRKKLKVMIDWAWDLFVPRDISQLP